MRKIILVTAIVIGFIMAPGFQSPAQSGVLSTELVEGCTSLLCGIINMLHSIQLQGGKKYIVLTSLLML